MMCNWERSREFTLEYCYGLPAAEILEQISKPGFCGVCKSYFAEAYALAAIKAARLADLEEILDLITSKRDEAFEEGKAVGSGRNLGKGALLYNQGHADGVRALANRLKGEKQITVYIGEVGKHLEAVSYTQIDELVQELTK